MMYVGECLTNDSRVLLIGIDNFGYSDKPGCRKVFKKKFNHAEFVGEELCSLRGMESAHYFLIGEGAYNRSFQVNYGEIKDCKFDIKIGSFDFREPGYDYFYIDDASVSGNRELLDMVLSMCPSEENQAALLDEILEMFAIDTFMGQTDRSNKNIMFMRNKDTREVHLAPLYDFQYSLKNSYLDPNTIYNNPLHCFSSIDDYKKFIEEFPEFGERLKDYLDIDLSSIIRRCYRYRGLTVPDEKFPFFKELEDGRKELIKKVIK